MRSAEDSITSSNGCRKRLMALSIQTLIRPSLGAGVDLTQGVSRLHRCIGQIDLNAARTERQQFVGDLATQTLVERFGVADVAGPAAPDYV